MHLPAALHLPGAFAGDLRAPGAPVARREPPGVSGVMQGIPGISHSQREPIARIVAIGALPCMPASERALVAEFDAGDPHIHSDPPVSPFARFSHL